MSMLHNYSAYFTSFSFTLSLGARDVSTVYWKQLLQLLTRVYKIYDVFVDRESNNVLKGDKKQSLML